MHPLAEDYTALNDTELQERINKISRVLRVARSGEVVNQALMLRQSLLAEQQRRYQELLEKSSNNSKLSDSINIS
jgi:hypothetical protein